MSHFRRLEVVYNWIKPTVHESLRNNRMFCSGAAEDVIFQRKGSAEIITLNRPKALNSLNLSMIRKLYPKYLEWAKSPNLPAVILMKGAGDKAFCAGGDIVAIYHAKKNGTSETKDFFREEYKLNHLIGSLSQPHVAILNGITMGGGVGLSVHGKFRVATDNTLFAMPETGIGFFCDVGGSYFLPRLPHNFGMYLGLTGARLKGYDVAAAGIATHFVSHNKLHELETKLIEVTDPAQVGPILDEFNERKEHSALLHHLPVIDRCFSKSSVEEILDALKAENSEWAKHTISLIHSMSPTSLKVVHRQLTNGSQLGFADCFKMEWSISQACMDGHDFFEGVRAQLVEKDRNPKWKPDSLAAVSTQQVDAHFAPVPHDELTL